MTPQDERERRDGVQGSRTPVTDPLARGALLGLTLHHGRAHVWRALCEAVYAMIILRPLGPLGA